MGRGDCALHPSHPEEPVSDDPFDYLKQVKGPRTALPNMKARESQDELHDAYQDNPALRRIVKARSWFDTSDPNGKAKALSIRFVQFIKACYPEYELSARDVMFAVELTALNVFNLEDFPLPQKEVQAIRKEASQYYEANKPDSLEGDGPTEEAGAPKLTPEKRDKKKPWYDLRDPDGKAKAITQRFIEYLRVCATDHDLSERDVVYTVELMHQNMTHMPGFPLSKAGIEKARDDAFRYYLNNRHRAPPPVKPV